MKRLLRKLFGKRHATGGEVKPTPLKDSIPLVIAEDGTFYIPAGATRMERGRIYFEGTE